MATPKRSSFQLVAYSCATVPSPIKKSKNNEQLSRIKLRIANGTDRECVATTEMCRSRFLNRYIIKNVLLHQLEAILFTQLT